MAYQQETLTYKQNMSKAEVFRVIKAIGLPLLVFGLGLFTISNFANFGAKLICPLSGAMWATGFLVALLMPSQRQETLNQTMVVCSLYFLALLGLKILLAVVSGVSSEMIAASYDQLSQRAQEMQFRDIYRQCYGLLPYCFQLEISPCR